MPEVRLCNKDAEIERIKQYCSARGCKYKYWSIYCKACEVSDIIDEFESAQEVDAKPVRHGRWIPTEYDSFADGDPVWDKWECSECGHEHSGEEDTLTAFCPDCGAKMDATDTEADRC